MSKRYTWTNKSVLSLAGNDDAISVITEKARELVLQYLEKGGSGPPFDPFDLANFLKIKVVPSDDVRDARTRNIGGAYVIDFNPNRTAPRVRYSIAHEIAHTLFPDCHEETRNRATHTEMRKDEWQLEMLCNIAAGEILMPVGSFSELRSEAVPIEHIVDLQRKFEVSIESLLLRFIRLTDQQCTLFSASRKDPNKAEYLIDYSIASSTDHLRLRQGSIIPNESVVSDCSAIGFTAKGKEQWPGATSVLAVECVGIPSFPGQMFPRVMGFLRPLSAQASPAPKFTIVRGDALKPRSQGKRIIAFVVNDATPNWGAGFALALKKKWPAVQRSFSNWVENNRNDFKLGGIFETDVDEETVAALLIAQKGYGPSRLPRIRYGALQAALIKLSERAQEIGASVHMPRIGTGQAGGNWLIIEEMIVEILSRSGVDVTIYDLSFRQPSSKQQQSSLFSLLEP